MKYLTIIVYLFTTLQLFARPEKLNFENYKLFTHIGVQDGLSDNRVNCIHRDKNGLLWIGTENGLNCYSGNQIEICSNEGRFDSLTLNSIEVIFPVDNKLLLGGKGFGLCYYYPGKKLFEEFNIDGFRTFELGNVFDIIYDSDSNIWIGTSSAGVLKYNLKDNVIEQFIVQPDLWVRDLFFNSEDELWISSWRNGVFIYNTYSRTFDKLELGFSNPVEDIVKDKYGKWFLATWGNGLIRINEISNNKVVDYEDMDKRFKMHSRHFTDLVLHDEEDLFAASKNGVFYWLRNGIEEEFEFNASYKNIKNPNPISSTKVLSLEIDDEFNLWIGTLNAGLNKVNWSQDYLKNYKYVNDMELESVYKIHDLNDNHLVLSNFNRSWVCDKKITNISPSSEHPFLNDLSKRLRYNFNYIDHISRISINYEDYLFLNAPFREFILYNIATGISTKIEGNENGFGNITSLVSDSYNNIWIGSYWGIKILHNLDSGLNKEFNYSELSFVNTEKALTSGVNEIFIDRDGDVWVLDKSYGVLCFKKNDCKYIRNLSKEKSLKTALNDLLMFDIKQLNDSILIFGSFQKGLILYNKHANSYNAIDSRHGFSSKVAKAILIDDDSDIWCGTEDGVFWLNLNKTDYSVNNIIRFSKNDGLLSTYCYKKALYKLPDNKIMFGTEAGFSVIDKKKFVANLYKAKVYVSEISLFKRSKKNFEEYVNYGSLKENKKQLKQLIIPYSNYAFKVKFSPLSFQNYSANSCAYRLVGYNGEWTYCTENDYEAYYQNLPAGEYLFQIKASNNHGLWNEDCNCLRVVIKPPFYGTLFFKITFPLLLILLFILVIYQRSRKLSVRNKELELKIQDKTHELKNNNDSLEELILMKNRFISVLSHDLKNSISSSYGLVDIIHSEYDMLDSKDKFKYLRSIRESLSSTLVLLENLVAWGKTVISAEKGIKFQQFNLSEAVDRTLKFCIETKKGITCVNKVSKDLEVRGNLNLFDTILRNLVDNAIKFSYDSGVINIESEADDRLVWLSVKDNGVGMSPYVIKNLFNIEKSLSQKGTHGEVGTGLGLIMVNDFIKRMGGEIKVESIEGKGTRITFSLLRVN